MYPPALPPSTRAAECGIRRNRATLPCIRSTAPGAPSWQPTPPPYLPRGSGRTALLRSSAAGLSSSHSSRRPEHAPHGLGGAKQRGLHGAEAATLDLRDLLELQFLKKSQHENLLLQLGERIDALAHFREPLVALDIAVRGMHRVAQSALARNAVRELFFRPAAAPPPPVDRVV